MPKPEKNCAISAQYCSLLRCSAAIRCCAAATRRSDSCFRCAALARRFFFLRCINKHAVSIASTPMPSPMHPNSTCFTNTSAIPATVPNTHSIHAVTTAVFPDCSGSASRNSRSFCICTASVSSAARSSCCSVSNSAHFLWQSSSSSCVGSSAAASTGMI